MKITKITNDIIRVHYLEQEALTRAFCRLQESWESPNEDFKNRPFTLGEYRVWYTQEMGAWTYYTDWNGFNMPSDALKPFIEGLFDPLTVEEKELVDALRYREGFYYVIGTHDDDDCSVADADEDVGGSDAAYGSCKLCFQDAVDIVRCCW